MRNIRREDESAPCPSFPFQVVVASPEPSLICRVAGCWRLDVTLGTGCGSRARTTVPRLPGNGVIRHLSGSARIRRRRSFTLSPLQPSAGPDQQLKKRHRAGQWSNPAGLVQPGEDCRGGDTGYVATEDIRSADRRGDRWRERGGEHRLRSRRNWRAQRQLAARSMGGDGYTIPPEAGNQERLPEPDAQVPPVPKVNARSRRHVRRQNPIFHQ